uniref:EOG090X0LZH n=1 Tax=Simocephalus serrulatus TaxID=117539 RepID=A0A4Y7NN14_9CRUS|nr:EOG090X0LZH [Simocephalus serrulatus]SVE94658.1 EOG090X0LZH [Simocephalus serrulatus]
MALETFDSDAVFKDKYRNLKRKLKFLIYENECFSMEIRNMEKRLLRILKDRTFLLDMLTQHEAASPAFESSDDDLTDSSDEVKMQHKNSDRKKKMKTERGTKKPPGIPSKPRRKPPNKLDKKSSAKPDTVANLMMEDSSSSKQEVTTKTGHMTPEEVVRHLESRRAQQSQLEFSFAPDKAPATVPTEMFSNDIEIGGGNFREFLDDMDTSPSNGGDENITIDMEHN